MLQFYREPKLPDGIDIGPENVDMVPFSAINELPQVRLTYDPDKLRELADSMTVDGSPDDEHSRINLVSPLTVGWHTKESARLYITEHGEFYQIATKDRLDVDDLTPCDADREHALILIAGHRRRRSISLLLRQMDIEPPGVRVAAQVHDDIAFGDAISLQFRENTYDRPPAAEEARAIELSYRHRWAKTGLQPTVRQLARELGLGETKVRNALNFAALPQDIQNLAHQAILSYTTVHSLRPLYDAFLRLHTRAAPQERESRAASDLMTFCMVDIQKTLQGKSEARLQRMISRKITEVEGAAAYQDAQGILFDGDFFTPQDRAARARQDVGALALRVVKHLAVDYSLEDLQAAHDAILREIDRRAGLF